MYGPEQPAPDTRQVGILVECLDVNRSKLTLALQVFVPKDTILYLAGTIIGK